MLESTPFWPTRLVDYNFCVIFYRKMSCHSFIDVLITDLFLSISNDSKVLMNLVPFHRVKLVLALNDNVVNIVYNCQVFFKKIDTFIFSCHYFTSM